MRGNTIAILLLATALTVPVGAATWFTAGTYEPDTACDDVDGCTLQGVTVAGGYMYVDPATQVDETRVYFNGYAQVGGAANPNSELTGSHIHPTGSMIQSAWLGVWKDCNADGYIGAANGAMDVYSAALGVDTDICEEGSVFNKGGWVYEFQWIGNGDHIAGHGGGNYPAEDDLRWINDSASRVWADWDLPGAVSAATCPLAPLAYGTTSSTGGAISHVDCIASRRIAGAINTAFATAGLGVCFENVATPERSNCVVNQNAPVSPFGNPYSGADKSQCQWMTGLLERNSKEDASNCNYNPNKDYDPDQDNRAFDVWNCDNPEGTTDQAGGVPQVSPSVDEDPLHASWYDGINATERGTFGVQDFLVDDVPTTLTGEPVSEQGIIGSGADTCSEDQDSSGSFFFAQLPGGAIEGPRAATGGGVQRSQTSTAFYFQLAGTLPRGEVKVISPIDGEAVLFDEGDTLGTDSGALRNDTLGQGYEAPGMNGAVVSRPAWQGTVNWVNTGTTINRNTLQPNAGRYVTYYATIGATTTGTGASTAKGAESIYGNEWCNGVYNADSNPADQFNCDAATWWNDAAEPEEPWLQNGVDVTVRPGQPYHVRDIDCYDGALVRGVNAQASLASLSVDGPCTDSSN